MLATVRTSVPRRAVALLLIVVVLFLTAVLSRSEPPPDDLQVVMAMAASVRPAPHPPAEIALVEGVMLYAPGSATILAGFHQAVGRALPLDPAGADDGYLEVMASRRRGTSSTSAVDIAVEPGSPVTSVVTGTVRAVDSYWLYGRTRDVLVEVIPDANPDIIVKMLHLGPATVDVGDRVIAGSTIVAEAGRLLPSRSQVDRYSECRCPHVHVEVRRG